MLVSKWIFVCSHHFHPFHRQRHFSNSVFFTVTTVIIACNTHSHYSRSNRSRFRASACLSGLGTAQKPPSRRVTNSLSSTLDIGLEYKHYTFLLLRDIFCSFLLLLSSSLKTITLCLWLDRFGRGNPTITFLILRMGLPV